MIDEKKIEEAAKEYAEQQEKICKELAEKYKSTSSICSIVSKNPDAVFKDGIHWFLDNLWHDVSEEPEEGKWLLTERKVVNTLIHEVCITIPISLTWNYIKAHNTVMVRWLYLDDLLKGGK